MKSALIPLRETQSSLSSTEANIAKFICDNPEKVSEMTIRDLAAATYSSPSSVVRLCRSAGFEGFRDFHHALLTEISSLGAELTHDEDEVEAGDSVEMILRKVTKTNIQSLEDSLHLLNPEVLGKSVELIKKSRTVLLFGMASSLYVAKDANLKFLRLNKASYIQEDYHSMIVQAKNSTKDDVAIIFSYSGQTKEMIEIMEILKGNNTPVIAITRFSPSPIAKMADYLLYIASNESLFRKGAMSSRLSQLNVVDVLITAYCNADEENTVKQLAKTYITKGSDSNQKN